MINGFIDMGFTVLKVLAWFGVIMYSAAAVGLIYLIIKRL